MGLVSAPEEASARRRRFRASGGQALRSVCASPGRATVRDLLPVGRRQVNVEARHHPALPRPYQTPPTSLPPPHQGDPVVPPIQTAGQRPSRRKVISPHLILLGEFLEGGSLW